MFRFATVQNCWPLPGIDRMDILAPDFEPDSSFICFLGQFNSTELPRLVADGRELTIEAMGRGGKAASELLTIGKDINGISPTPKITAAMYSTRLAKWAFDRLPAPPTAIGPGKWPDSVLSWCEEVNLLIHPEPTEQSAIWRMPWLDLYASNADDLKSYVLRSSSEMIQDKFRPMQVPEDAPPQVYGWVSAVLAVGGDHIATPPSDLEDQATWMHQLNATVDDM